MISEKTLDAYEEQFKGSHSSYDFSIGNVVLYIDGDIYACPANETDKEFRDRMKRSKEAGKNLFKKEWKKLKYKQGVLY